MKQYKVTYAETAIVMTTRIIKAESKEELLKGEWEFDDKAPFETISEYYMEALGDWIDDEENWEIEEYNG